MGFDWENVRWALLIVAAGGGLAAVWRLVDMVITRRPKLALVVDECEISYASDQGTEFHIEAWLTVSHIRGQGVEIDKVFWGKAEADSLHPMKDATENTYPMKLGDGAISKIYGYWCLDRSQYKFQDDGSLPGKITVYTSRCKKSVKCVAKPTDSYFTNIIMLGS
ncbi:MAG: hypothetical protein ABIJ00_02070 [Candidatus Eisenbacteria bacterium]